MTISSGPADGSATNDPTPTFRFSPTEPGSTFQCRYEGHGFSACSGARSDTAASPLSDGPHTFCVRAIDAAGNRGDALDVKFAVDTAAPELKIKGPSKTRTKRRKAAATFTLKASEQVGRRCRIDSRRFKPCSERYRTPRLRRGTHTLKVKATDRAGNVGTKRKRFRIVEEAPDGSAADGRKRSLSSAVSRSRRNPDRLTPRRPIAGHQWPRRDRWPSAATTRSTAAAVATGSALGAETTR